MQEPTNHVLDSKEMSKKSGFLSNLIRINTTNPPGNETAAPTVASIFQEVLKRVIESSPGRGR
jgi:hypothetical protein